MTIAQLRTSIEASLNDQALLLGEDAELDNTDATNVSWAVDAANETWNENLPPRPHS